MKSKAREKNLINTCQGRSALRLLSVPYLQINCTCLLRPLASPSPSITDSQSASLAYSQRWATISTQRLDRPWFFPASSRRHLRPPHRPVRRSWVGAQTPVSWPGMTSSCVASPLSSASSGSRLCAQEEKLIYFFYVRCILCIIIPSLISYTVHCNAPLLIELWADSWCNVCCFSNVINIKSDSFKVCKLSDFILVCL